MPTATKPATDTAPPLIVRTSTPSDVGPVYDLLCVMAREMAIYPVNMTKVQKNMLAVFQHGIVIVAVEGGKVIGSIGLVPQQTVYSDVTHIEDQWTYVHPDHRRHGVARQMRDLAVSFAEQHKVPLHLEVYNLKNPIASRGLYLKAGFKALGEKFIYFPKSMSEG
jgi:GNAT superfamily N-acetyltransferase